MTIHWKVVEEYFTVVLFVFQVSPVCNFGKFIELLILALSGIKGLTSICDFSYNQRARDMLGICSVIHMCCRI